MSVSISKHELIVVACCRAHFWFWDSMVLLQTLALAASQAFATSLHTYFQFTIVLMMFVIGITVSPHYRPVEESLSQSMQVSIPGIILLLQLDMMFSELSCCQTVSGQALLMIRFVHAYCN